MHLTQKQESLISQYLRDVSRRLDSSLPDKVRERSLRQIQTRIYRELEGMRSSPISDDDVVAVLRRSAVLTERAPAAAPLPAVKPDAPAPSPPGNHRPQDDSSAKPVWLGVCAYNAERLGVETWMVRLGAVLLGVITGPIAIVCYVGAFVEYYFSLDEKDRPPIEPVPLLLRTLGPVAVLLLLRWGAGRVESLIAYGYERLAGGPLPHLGEWAWLRYYESTFFYLAFLSVVPLGALSGLPMANAWGHSLKRVAQAIVALYGVLLCFGLASVLVGVILARVEVYLQ